MDRCSLCSGVNLCLPAEGPRGDTLFVGEAPGGDENRRRCIFIGKTGQELNGHYLALAGLRRPSIRIMNAIACLPNTPKGKLDPNSRKHRELLDACANQHLYPELAEHTPKLIVPMGAFACRAIDPDLDLTLHHGMPRMTRWGILAFPMYHPALGIHSPKKMLDIRTDWIRLGRYLQGKLILAIDELQEPDYAEITNPDELLALDPTLPLAADTESSPSLGPYCVTLSQWPGTGRLLRCSNHQLMSALADVFGSWESDVLFHNWLYDAGVLSTLGLLLPNLQRRVRDTMAWTYHLGNLPQGLKALAWRLLGMAMEDFEDVVTPYSTERVLDYYRRAQDVMWPKPDPELEINPATGLYELYKPQSMNTKLKRFFTDYTNNPAKNVFDMWTKNWTNEQTMIEAKLGPWPGLDIAHVPFHRVLRYACRDVDALIRLAPILLAMRERVTRYPQEEWGGGSVV